MLSGNGSIYDLFRTWIFGCILGAPLAPFWHPLGSTYHPFSFDWLPFGVLLLPSRFIIAPFGALGVALPAMGPHFVRRSDLGGTILHQNVISGAQDLHILGAFVRARHSYDTKFPQNLPCGSQLRKAPELNRQKPPSKELLLCRTPHPPGPLRNFAAGNLDKRRV